LGQPLAEDKAVKWAEDQPFGATGRARYDTDVFWPQAVFADVGQGLGAGVDVKGLHGSIVPVRCTRFESLGGFCLNPL
jgi:hypothetical protein